MHKPPENPIMAAMYQQHFGLNELPFSIAPDPRYLYMSERHREALAHLVYGLNSDGAFILLSGDVGTGKTTVSRCLLEQIPDNTKVALVLNPKVSALELLETICDELYGQHAAPHLNVPNSQASIKLFVDIINRYLLDAHAKGKKTVILIEEAQNLDLDVLEQLRLLTNLETNEHKLLQIILLGQPELLHMLEQPELSQLAQRITARYHLTPLNENELRDYVAHRLAIAGTRQSLFPDKVLKRLYKITGGVPRLVNVICDRALLGTYVQGRQQVNVPTLMNAAREVMGPKSILGVGNSKPYRYLAWAAMLLVVIAAPLYVMRDDLFNPAIVQQTSEQPADIEAVEEIINLEATESVADASIAWPDDAGRLRSNLLAYQAVFEQWKMDYLPQQDGTPCYFAQTRGLACMQASGNLAELRGFNRPSVLILRDPQGQTYYAAITGLGSSSATIHLAGHEQTVSLDELNRYWYGDFTLLWQQPPGFETPMKPGHSGQDVIWLSQKLKQIQGNDALSEASIYQTELVDKVRSFQISQGLVADGIVGVQTLIHLNNFTEKDSPVLNKNG
ncbi:MAG TPA: AAA family ATPase [Gammaproteobacteria bacterium]